MMNPARHIIQRQTVWLDTPGQPPSFGLQERMSTYCRHQLPAVLEKLFDRFAEVDTIVRIDQLSIDAGQLSVTNLEEELTQQIVRQVEQVLGQLSGQTNANPTASSADADTPPILGRVERFRQDERRAEQVRYFLVHGRLPVWADARDFGQLKDWLSTPQAAAFRQELAAIVRKNPALVSRLVHHSTDQTLLLLVFETSDDTLTDKIRLLLAVSQTLTHQPLAVLRERYWKVALHLAASGKASFSDSLIDFCRVVSGTESLPLFIRRLLVLMEQQNGSNPTAATTGLGKHLTNLLAETVATPATDKLLSTTEVRTDQPTPTNQPEHDSTWNSVENPLAKATNAHFPPSVSRASSRPTPRHKPAGEEELFVPLAGIILLHPFLLALFTEMELLVNRQWAYDLAPEKAVQMLAYLATGQDYCPEYDMPLLKLLCGLPFDHVVSPELTLTNMDRQLATELLEAVIDHWKALGSVSPDGLREAFLQREGKLKPTDTGWRLTVEQKTLDILLSKLPWGCSPIKLPFMTDLLFVDWT